MLRLLQVLQRYRVLIGRFFRNSTLFLVLQKFGVCPLWLIASKLRDDVAAVDFESLFFVAAH